MKNPFVVLFMIFISFQSWADGKFVRFASESVNNAIKTMVPADKQDAVAIEYALNMENATGKISVDGLAKVCVTAGWNPRVKADAEKCKQFAKMLSKKIIPQLSYFEVCGQHKGKTGGKEYCVDDFKGRWTNGIRVTPLQAEGLAKEWALVKNKHNIKCDMQPRQSDFDDFIKCTSTDNKNFYEFQFDTINASIDSKTSDGVLNGVCDYIYGVKSNPKNCVSTVDEWGGAGTLDTRYVAKETITCWEAFCEADQNKCKSLNESFKRFGWSAEFGKSNKDGRMTCNIYKNFKYDLSQLKTIPGIDNLIFSKDIQIKASPDLVNIIKRYVTVQLKKQDKMLYGFRCNNGVTQISNFSGLFMEFDDILTCYAKDEKGMEHQIDFLFDDLSEYSKHTQRGGFAGLQCVKGEGAYDGKNCWLGKDNCIALDKALKAENPRSLGAQWKDELGACLLLDAKAVHDDARTQKWLIFGGITAIGCASAVFTAGSSTGACLVAVVEVAALTVELLTEQIMEEWSNQFIRASLDCNNNICAEQTIAKHLARAAGVKSNLRDAAVAILDREIERLAGLLPDYVQDKIFRDPNKDAWDEAVAYFSAKMTPLEETVKIANTTAIVVQFTSLGVSGIKILKNAPRVFRNMKIARQSAKAVGNKILDYGGKIGATTQAEANKGNSILHLNRDRL